MLSLIPITFIELFCLFVAIFTLGKDNEVFWRVTVVYLFLMCGVEVTNFVNLIFLHKGTAWLYNLYIPIEFSYISYVFYTFIGKTPLSKALLWAGYLMIWASYTIEMIKKDFGYATVTISVMSVLFVLYSLYFYAFLLKNEGYLELKYYAPFWMVAGILLFYFGGTVFNLVYDLVLIKMKVRNPFITYIPIILNFLLYSFWSYSFICRARQRKLYP